MSGKKQNANVNVNQNKPSSTSSQSTTSLFTTMTTLSTTTTTTTTTTPFTPPKMSLPSQQSQQTYASVVSSPQPPVTTTSQFTQIMPRTETKPQSNDKSNASPRRSPRLQMTSEKDSIGRSDQKVPARVIGGQNPGQVSVSLSSSVSNSRDVSDRPDSTQNDPSRVVLLPKSLVSENKDGTSASTFTATDVNNKSVLLPKSLVSENKDGTFVLPSALSDTSKSVFLPIPTT